MAYINTWNKLVDSAFKHLYPFLKKCEDLDTLIKIINKELDNVKTATLEKCIYEFDNEIREECPSNWTIVKRLPRSVVCVFGKVTFLRTLFKDEYGRNRYLCDELLGIRERSRFTTDAFLWLLNKVTILSYGKTAKAFKEMSGYKVSKMTIWNNVQEEARLIMLHENNKTYEQVSQDSICVESDGIFLPMQSSRRRKEAIERYLYEDRRKKKSFELKCGCIYAGKVKEKTRTRRINVSLVAGINSTPKFWERMNTRVCAEYVLDDINNIRYASDGGQWCKNHKLDMIVDSDDKIKQSIDKFHVYQTIWKAFPEAKKYDYFVGLVIKKKPEKLLKTIDKVIKKMKGNKRKKARELRKYLTNNIDLLKAGFNLGTMEATHAYVWAKRMKHIGGAWSKKGGHAMAVVLAHYYSGKRFITPSKSRLFNKKDKKTEEKYKDKMSCDIANQWYVGNGYMPEQGKIPKLNRPIYIPWDYLPKSSL